MTTTRAAIEPPAGAQPKNAAYPRIVYAIGLALFVVAFALFLPSVRHEFVSYDDIGFVTKNDWVKNGLTRENIVHAIQSTEMANWHPVTWLSYLVDAQYCGVEPWGYHFTNTLLHALNTVLVFVLLLRLTGAVWRSAFVAALFGWHPMHVESVAWVAERKDVLSAAFWLLTMVCYANWVQRRSAGRPRAATWYVGSLVIFALGLMAKPMLVTLPCALLLLDYWPLRRLGSGSSGDVTLGKLVAEKTPFFALAAVDSVITFKTQAGIGAVLGLTRLSWSSRVANALVSYVQYLCKCVFPVNLAVYYPYTPHSVAAVVGAGVVLLALSLVALQFVRQRPYLIVGWLWFLGTLVPVIGLVQVGGQAMADRYTYLPYLGVFLAVTWTVCDLTRVWPRRRFILAPAAALILTASAIATVRQLTCWQNSGTLWGRAVAVTKDNVPAHLGLGYYYSDIPSRLEDAIAEYREAVRLSPTISDPHRSLAALLARQRATLPEAISEYKRAIALDPNYVPAYLALGAAAEQLAGHLSDAVAAYAVAARLDPNNADAHNRLGNVLSQEPDRVADAIAEFRTALRLRPDWVEVHLNLGAALSNLPGHLDEAIAEYRKVVAARPDYAEAHNNLANALARVPNATSDAIAEYEAAIRLKPDYVEARYNYAVLLGFTLGRRDDAIGQLEAALRAQPDFTPARQLIERLRSGP